MKKTILMLSIIFAFQAFAQRPGKESVQKEYLEKAMAHIENSKPEKACFNCLFAHQAILESIMGKEALSISDSLKTALRQNLLRHVQGKWKWKRTDSNWGTRATSESSDKERYLIISDREIYFYERKKDAKKYKLSKTEKFVFYESEALSLPHWGEFQFSDKQIWRFDITAKTLNTTNTGEIKAENTRSRIVYGSTTMRYERVQ